MYIVMSWLFHMSLSDVMTPIACTAFQSLVQIIFNTVCLFSQLLKYINSTFSLLRVDKNVHDIACILTRVLCDGGNFAPEISLTVMED